MTLELTGAFTLLLIIIIPMAICFIALLGGSLKYWKDKRKEPLNEYDFIASFEEEDEEP